MIVTLILIVLIIAVLLWLYFNYWSTNATNGGTSPSGSPAPSGSGWNATTAPMVQMAINSKYLSPSSSVLGVSIPTLDSTRAAVVANAVRNTYSYNQFMASIAPVNVSSMTDMDLRVGLDIMSKVQTQVGVNWNSMSEAQLLRAFNLTSANFDGSCVRSVVNSTPLSVTQVLYLNALYSSNKSVMNLPSFQGLARLARSLINCRRR